MVYIARDGTVRESRPWGLGLITDFFWGILNFFYAFFQTLIPGGNGGNTDGTRGGKSGGSGGPGGPGGPRRRMGGIQTIQDCNIPGGG